MEVGWFVAVRVGVAVLAGDAVRVAVAVRVGVAVPAAGAVRVAVALAGAVVAVAIADGAAGAAASILQTCASFAANGPWYHPSFESWITADVVPVGKGTSYEEKCSTFTFRVFACTSWPFTRTVPIALNRSTDPAGAGANVNTPLFPTSLWSARSM